MPQVEVRYRLVVHREALVPSEEAYGWTVLATTLRPEGVRMPRCSRPYQEQHITVEPGFRWSKNPAAISPVWLEKPERIAALAMLTVVAYSSMQSSNGKSGSISAIMSGTSPAIRPDGHAYSGRGVCPLYARDAGPLRSWTMRLCCTSMASRRIIGSFVRPWGLIMPGIREWQRGKIRSCRPHPLEHGLEF